MQQQIKFLHQILEEINNNPSNSMNYFTGPCQYTQGKKPPSVDIKWILIEDALHRIQHGILNNENCIEVDHHIATILNKLNEKYQYTQHLCWRSHEHHFHTCFKDYINCPITCLAEICEYLEKLQKELYNT